MKCAFCGAEVFEPHYETIGGKRYVFHSAVCAAAFRARVSSLRLARAGGIVALLGGAISLYSAFTASSMSGAAGSMAAPTVGWPLAVLGLLVLATGMAIVVMPTKVPMRLGGALMLVYGALMTTVFLSGHLSLALIAMNAGTTWMMLVMGIAMFVFGILMLGMPGGMAEPATRGARGALLRLGAYSTVIALAVILTIGGLAASNMLLPSGAVHMPGGNQTTTTTMPTTTTTTPGGNQTTGGPKVWTVQITGSNMGGFYFQPYTITISVGDTVNWTCISGRHTVTSDPGQAVSFDSGTLTPGQFFNYTFNVPGNFTYRSTIDMAMTGVVVVTQPG